MELLLVYRKILRKRIPSSVTQDGGEKEKSALNFDADWKYSRPVSYTLREDLYASGDGFPQPVWWESFRDNPIR